MHKPRRPPAPGLSGKPCCWSLASFQPVYALKAPGSGSLSMPALALLLVAGVALVARFAYLQATVNAPMLDLRLVTNPILLAGIIMAMVASGALAGVKLTLAQGPQYVLGKTPLQAGMFMLPIMVAAGIGGPLAGWLSNRFGLRAVASASLPSAAITSIAMAARCQSGRCTYGTRSTGRPSWSR